MENMVQGLVDNTWQMLKRRVWGHVYVSVRNENMHITIERKDVTFSYTVYDVEDKIRDGLTSEDVCQQAVREYRRQIDSIFFK